MLDRLFQPHWAGGWTAARVLFALSALGAHGQRASHIGDAYGVTDMVFDVAPFHMAQHVVLSEASAWQLWWITTAALLLVLWGGRAAKIGVVVWLVAGWTFLASEALSVKAYDRLLLFIGLGMLAGPIHERGLTGKWRSPVGRWVLMLTFGALYTSTGWFKALTEPGWWTGDALAYDMVHQWFGSRPLGVWLSGVPWAMKALSWVTLAFECTFAVLILFRRTNPWLLLVGVGMHLGIQVLMNVGPFSYVVFGAYPVLLHPEVARRLYLRWRRWRGLDPGPAAYIAA